MVVGAALVVFTVGNEILGRELQRGDRAAIARLPGGLLRPFLVRLSLFAILLATCATIGRLATTWTLEALQGKPLLGAPLVRDPGLVVLIATTAAFGLAASCWLRQSTLAAPLGLLLVGIAFVLPLAIPIEGKAAIETFSPYFGAAVALVLVTGLVAAWFSFSQGLSRGGGRRGAVKAGMLAIFAGMLPIHGYAAIRAVEWLRCEPGDPEFRIDDFMLGTSGRYAFVVAGRGNDYDHQIGIVVDLSNGAWKKVGPDCYFTPLEGDPFGMPPLADARSPQRYVRCVTVVDGKSIRSTIHDGETGETIGEFDELMKDAAWKQRFVDDARNATSIRLTDGHRVFALDSTLYRDVPGGPPETMALPRDTVRLGSDEFGLFYRERGGPNRSHEFPPVVYRDLRTDEDRVLPPSALVFGSVARFENELVFDCRRACDKRNNLGAQLVSDDLSFRPFPELPDGGFVVGVTTEGNAVLLLPNPKQKGWQDYRVERMRPQTHELIPVRFGDGSPAIVSFLYRPGEAITRTPNGSLFLRGERRNGTSKIEHFVARLDDASSTLIVAPSPAEVTLGSPLDDETAIVLGPDHRSLVRVRFGSNESKIVFPVARADS